MKYKRLSIISIALFNVVNAFAAPEAGDLLRQQQELDRFKNLPQNIPLPKKEEAPRKAPQAAAKILVNSFKFEGNLGKFSAEDLSDLVKDLVGQELTFDEIQLAADRITTFYQEKGFFLARAIVPKQEVINGVVVIRVNQGQLDPQKPFVIKGENLRMPTDRLESYLTNAMGDTLYQPHLERGLLNIADNPSMSASANIEPGDAKDTSRIIVEVIEGPKFDGSITADNYGSRYTGANRLTGLVNWNNPSTYGDQLSLTAVQAPGEVFDMGKIAYALPLGTDGWRANISYTYLRFALGKEMATDPASRGVANNINIGLRYPIIRTATSALYWGGTYDWKSSYNEATGVATADNRVNVFGTNLTWEQTDNFLSGGFTQAQIGLAHGRLDLSRNEDNLLNDQDVTGAQTNGAYSKTTWQLLRIQRGTERFSIQALAAGQRAHKNLDGSEKFSLGGPTGVRAYPGGEASGDHGFKFSLDAKYLLTTATQIGDITGVVFYDYGQVTQYKNVGQIDLNGIPGTYHLAGWGLALEAVAAGKSTIKVAWAKPIGSNPSANATTGNNSDGKPNQSRYWLIATLMF
jgi:hemolysin activation/secretion protein